MTRQLSALVAALALVAAWAWGFLIGSSLGRPEGPKIEPPAAAIRHRSGALTLERDPHAEPPPPVAEAPPGAIRVRAATVEIPPHAEPVTLQMDLWKMPDGTQRITTGAQGIILTNGLDIPTASKDRAAAEWAAGVLLTSKGEPGAWAAKKYRHTEIFLSATKTTVAVGIGLRF